MIRPRHHQQAHQLYDALRRRDQTWTQSEAALERWAEDFAELEDEDIGRKKITRILDWYCDHGIGALYVPLVGHAESFRMKFPQVAAAKRRLANQPLTYFDDVLKYNYGPTNGAVKGRNAERSRICHKISQQVGFIDDLMNGRAKLPKHKAKVRTNNGKPKKLSKADRHLLKQYKLIHEDVLFSMLLQIPEVQQGLRDRLDECGYWEQVNRRLLKTRTTQRAKRPQKIV